MTIRWSRRTAARLLLVLERHLRNLGNFTRNGIQAVCRKLERFDELADGDPQRCALALASRRTWGDNAYIWFLRTVAYLVFSDRDSRMRAERFRQPGAAGRPKTLKRL
jgi:hypothetical protein